MPDETNSRRSFSPTVPRPLAGGGSSIGTFRPLSVNTWLIVINIAVFIIANVILGQHKVEISAGRTRNDGVTDAQLVAGHVVRNVRVPFEQPSPYFGYRIIDQTGRTLGYERVTYRPIVEGLGHFSTGKALELQVWRFITFQFLHASPTHLLFNMLGLFFVGGLVEQYLGRRRFLAFYFVCGIAGAFCYLLLNAIGYAAIQMQPALAAKLPALLFNDVYTPLVGASAGVFGVLMAAAFIAPREIVSVFLVIPMQLRNAVYLFLAAAFLNLVLGGNNAGGDAAHVGGAIAGAYFIRHAHLLRDFFQLVGGPIRPPTPLNAHSSKKPLAPGEAELDRILRKVDDSGIESLTPTERSTLRQASSGLGS